MKRYSAFCKVVELGSFTKAAESLGYTQSAISQMIRSLEEELAITLLVRTRTGIRMTPEGEKLYPIIRKNVNDNRELTEKAREIRGLHSGEVRIGTFTSISQHWLPELIKGFRAKYPEVGFSLYQGDYNSIYNYMKAGTIDFGFIDPLYPSGLSAVPLARDEFLAVLPEDHPLAGLERVPLSGLTEDPLILVEEGTISEPLSAFSKAGLTPNIQYRIHDDYTILSMVEHGLGISIMPAMVLGRTNYHFRAIPTQPRIFRDICAVYDDLGSMPVASREFLKYLVENLPNCFSGKYTSVKAADIPRLQGSLKGKASE